MHAKWTNALYARSITWTQSSGAPLMWHFSHPKIIRRHSVHKYDECFYGSTRLETNTCCVWCGKYFDWKQVVTRNVSLRTICIWFFKHCLFQRYLLMSPIWGTIEILSKTLLYMEVLWNRGGNCSETIIVHDKCVISRVSCTWQSVTSFSNMRQFSICITYKNCCHLNFLRYSHIHIYRLPSEIIPVNCLQTYGIASLRNTINIEIFGKMFSIILSLNIVIGNHVSVNKWS